MYLPADIYLYKVNNGNNRKMYEICSKLTKATERRLRRRSGIFTVDFEQVFRDCSDVSIVDFKHVNANWVLIYDRHLGLL